MKKLLLGLLMMAGSVFAADTITPRLGLIDPEAGSTGWASKMTHNFNVLDSSVAILSSTQTFTGGVTITSGTISTLRANSVLIATPTYSGSDVLVVNGTSRFQNSIFACDTNWLNCGSLDESTLTLDNGPTSASINILHDGSVNGGMLLRAAGTFINTTSNSPAPLYAKTITVGPDWYTAGTALETPSNSENAFEYAVLVGTTTNTANAKMVILSSSAYAYDLVVGSAPVPQGKYHLAVSTSGNVYIPSLTSGECMQVGTGGLLTTTGSGCGSGGGGSSTLAVFEDSVKVSSPTSIVKFDGTDFNVSLVGGSTAFVVLGDSITVTGLTLSSMTVRSIYWADGTVQVSSPGAGGGGSGDITGVAVSGEGITGGGTSGDVTIVLGSTVAYTTKNQTWTAPQNFSTNTILGNATFYHNASPSTHLTWDGRRILVRRDGSYTGGLIAIRNGDIIGSPPRNACLDLIADSGTEGTPAQVCNVAGSYISLFDSAGSAVFRGATSSGILLSTNTIIPGTTIYHNGPIATTVDVTVGGQSVCLEDGTNCPASGGSGGGYAVEPATVTFQLSKGVTASTGTFTDLLIGTTISASEVFQIDEETALRFIPSSSGTYVGVTRTTGTPAFATFVGHKAGQFANTGSGVTAVGYRACHGAGAGPSDSTTCVGQDAGLVLNGGVNNTLIGIKAGQKMTDGSNNVCVGDVACNEVTSGAENVHLGNFAYSYTGTNSQNVLVGYQSQVGAGSRNTCLGTYSCSINTNQADNVAVGYSASIGAGATKAVAIGANATASQSNTMKLGGELSDSVTVLMSSSVTSGWSVARGSATFVSSMTLSGGYLVQNIPPTNGQVLKFDGTNWAPGSDATGGGGGTTIWVQKDDSDVDVSVSTIDVRSPLAATSNPSGEVNLDVDRSSFTLVGPKVDLDTLEVSGRLGESNIVSTAAFTTKVQNWTVEQTFSSGSVAGPWSVDGNLYVGGRSFSDAANYIASNGQVILNRNQSTNDVTVRTANSADAWSVRGITNRVEQSVPLFIMAGSSVSYFDDSSNLYVMARSSFSNVHSQRYLLTDSTGPVGSPLKIANIDSNGFVSLVWGTDNTGGGGDNLGDHVSTMTLTASYGIAVSTIAGVAVAAQFSGADCGAKINSASAYFGSSAGEIWVDQTCGTAWESSVTIKANQILRFTQGGTYTSSGSINGGHIIGSGFGAPHIIGNAPTIFKQANNANLPYMIRISTNGGSVQNLEIDCSSTTNVSSGDGILVNGGRGVLIQDVFVHNAARDGIRAKSGTTSNNDSGIVKMVRVVSYNNQQDGFHSEDALDHFASMSEFEGNFRYGVFLHNSGATRIEHSDIAQNREAGFVSTGTASGLGSNYNVLVGNQWGNNYKEDIIIDGYTGSTYVSIANVITGNFFYGGGNRPDSTYASVSLKNTNNNSITGNVWNSPAANKYTYGLSVVNTGASSIDTWMSNRFNGSYGTGEENPMAGVTASCSGNCNVQDVGVAGGDLYIGGDVGSSNNTVISDGTGFTIGGVTGDLFNLGHSAVSYLWAADTAGNLGLFGGFFGSTLLVSTASIKQGGELRFNDGDASHYVAMKSSSAINYSQNYVLPDSTGTAGTVLAIAEVKSNGDVNLEWKTDDTGGGGGGSDALKSSFTYTFMASDSHLGASNSAVVERSTNALTPILLFDASTVEHSSFTTVLRHFVGGTIKVQVFYSMRSATSGTVEFDAAIACITPGDAQDIDSGSFAAYGTATETVPGTAGYLSTLTITPTNDSCAEGDVIMLSLFRDAGDGTNDTATGDAEVRFIRLYEE